MRRSLFFAVLLLAGLDAAAGLALRAGWVGGAYAEAQASWRQVESCDCRPRWLVLGDSAAGSGVLEEPLGRELGAPAMNLSAVADFTVLNLSWLAQRYVERCGPPIGVILAHTPTAWAVRTPPPEIVPVVAADWAALGRLSPPVRPFSEEGASLLLARWAPLYYFGEELGFELLGRPALAPGQKANPVRGLPPSLSDVNRRGLSELLALADRAGFDVHLVLLPIGATRLAEPDERRRRDGVLAQLEEVARERPRLRIAAQMPAAVPDEAMYGPRHFRPSFAPELTRLLAAAVRAQPRNSAAPYSASSVPGHSEIHGDDTRWTMSTAMMGVTIKKPAKPIK